MHQQSIHEIYLNYTTPNQKRFRRSHHQQNRRWPAHHPRGITSPKGDTISHGGNICDRRERHFASATVIISRIADGRRIIPSNNLAKRRYYLARGNIYDRERAALCVGKLRTSLNSGQSFVCREHLGCSNNGDLLRSVGAECVRVKYKGNCTAKYKGLDGKLLFTGEITSTIKERWR
ncbi:hypothetical protein CEXT_46381 [Caerostris extrusa]|uniref:Uncharacterized protein n=1 Tax=Caerostris extrusa TaxID=172846 RepID=A0AAV4SBA6_CAEEX|nr:hypothetical protein CEXT_46381 [Caerostris extrusa]